MRDRAPAQLRVRAGAGVRPAGTAAARAPRRPARGRPRTLRLPRPRRSRRPARRARRRSNRSGREAGRRAVRDSGRLWAGVQRHGRRSSPLKPHGHGFIAATSTKRAGKTAVRAARAIVTRPSSSGCRSTSSTRRSNSGISSRNSTPLCASEISPGRGNGAAADEGDVRNGVMRCAEGALGQKADALWQRAGHRVDRGALERFVERQRRKDRSEAPRHHRLAGARRAGEQQVVSPGRRHFQGAPREELPAHVREVPFVTRRRWRWSRSLRAGEWRRRPAD